MALPILTFVYRPGGDANHNVFTDWPSLMAVLHRVEGRKIIEFDDSIIAPDPCWIPAGTWNMRDVMWAGCGPRTGVPRPTVAIQEGAILQELRMIGGQITIDNQAETIPPISDFGPGPNHIHIGMRDDCGNSQLMNSGTAPMFDLGNRSVLILAQNCLLGIDLQGRDLHPLIRQSAGGSLTINLIGQNQTGKNLIENVSGATVLFGALSSSTQIALEQSTMGGTNEFAPVTRIQRKVRPRPPSEPAKDAIPVDEIGKPNELLRCDGNGLDGNGFTQLLPSIKGGFFVRAGLPLYTGGQEIVVAEVAGGRHLQVQGSSGDTIDSSANPVKFGAYESRVFASDGESNWITIASHLNPPISLPQQLSLRAIQLERLIIPHVGGFGRRDFAFDLPGLSGRGFVLLNVSSTARVGLSITANGDLVVSREVEKNVRATIHEALPPNLLESGNALTVEVSFSGPANPEISISDLLVIYQSG